MPFISELPRESRNEFIARFRACSVEDGFVVDVVPTSVVLFSKAGRSLAVNGLRGTASHGVHDAQGWFSKPPPESENGVTLYATCGFLPRTPDEDRVSRNPTVAGLSGF